MNDNPVNKRAVDQINGQIDELSADELGGLIDSLKEAQKQRAADLRDKAIAEILRIAEEAGVGVTITPLKTKETRGAKKGSKAKIKYRNPDTGEQWSGRGISPKWINAIKDNPSLKLSDFEV